jgi:exosortase/archaeosortase family protein
MSGTTALGRAWERNRAVLRFWLVFVAILCAFQAAFTTGERVWSVFDRATAVWLAWCLSAAGENARVDGTIVTSALGSFEIIHACTVAIPAAIFIAALLAYPLTWTARIVGIAAGVPALAVVNQARLVALCYVGRAYPAAFESAHMLVGQSVVVLATVLLAVAWLAVAPRLDAARRT